MTEHAARVRVRNDRVCPSVFKALMLLLTHFVGLGKSFLSVVENPGGKHCCVFVPGRGDYSEWREGFGSYSRTVKIWVMAISCVCVCVCMEGGRQNPQEPSSVRTGSVFI